MRIAKNTQTFVTLDGDIVNIWKMHGWDVLMIQPVKKDGKDQWIITARRKVRRYER